MEILDISSVGLALISILKSCCFPNHLIELSCKWKSFFRFKLPILKVPNTLGAQWQQQPPFLTYTELTPPFNVTFNFSFKLQCTSSVFSKTLFLIGKTDRFSLSTISDLAKDCCEIAKLLILNSSPGYKFKKCLK